MVENELISKKELLELTGISYGQLYRWKRKNLIPEEWFIRKSTFTGQETFFPRDKILARVARIKDMKDDLSLDELADVLSPNAADIVTDIRDISERNIVSKQVLNMFLEIHPGTDQLRFANLFALFVAEAMIQTGKISLEEAKLVLQTLMDHYDNVAEKNCELWFARKMGVAVCLLLTSPTSVYFDSGTRVIQKLPIADCMEQLNLKLTRGDIGGGKTI